MLSALFLNDTILLMFTPLVLGVVAALGRNPIPYLIALATAANIGSVATITGNPQNMLIGVSSGLGYLHFAARLTPIALGGMALIWLVVVFLHPAEFARRPLPAIHPIPVNIHRPLLKKSTIITGLMLVAFVVGVPIPLAALGAAALLLITRRWEPEHVFLEVDWSLLVFLSGLFMVTGALEVSGWSERLFAAIQPLTQQGIMGLTAVAAVLSDLICVIRPFRPGPQAQAGRAGQAAARCCATSRPHPRCGWRD